MNRNLFPTTNIGKWAGWLMAAAFLLFIVFIIVVATGFRGGETWDFFADFWPTLPMLLAGVAALSSLVTGLIGIIKSKERSLLVFLTTGMGFFTLFFLLGEFLSPH